jgi:hypothetical protein
MNLSPKLLESYCNHYSSRVLNRLKNAPSIFQYLAVSLLAAALYSTCPVWTQAYPGWSRFDIAQKLLWAIVTIVIGSLWVHRIPMRWMGLYFFTISTTAWAYNAWGLEQKWQTLLLAPLALLLGYTCLKVSSHFRSLKAKVTLSIFYSLLLLLLILFFGKLSFANQDYDRFSLYWLIHPEYHWLFVIYWIGANVSYTAREKLACALHPIFVLSPLPLPTDISIATDETEIRRNWWHGYFNILLAFGIYFLAMQWLKSETLNAIWAAGTSHAYAVMLRNWSTAIYVALIITGAMNAASGILRLYRLKVPDTTYYLLLAKTPLEFWQRSSCYLYHFTMRCIFIPFASLFRSTRLGFIAVGMFMVLNLFLLHDVMLKNLFKFFIPNLPIEPQELTVILSQVVFWVAGWFGLFFIFSFVSKSKAFQNVIVQWLSVFVTSFLVGNIADISYTFYLLIARTLHF